MVMTAAAVGAVAGVASAKLEPVAPDLVEDPIDHAQEEIRDTLKEIHRAVHNALAYLETLGRPPITTPGTLALLGNNSMAIALHGRRHARLFVGTAGNLTADIPGIGYMTWAVNPGWNILDLPDGTGLYAKTVGDIQNVLLQVLDNIYG